MFLIINGTTPPPPLPPTFTLAPLQAARRISLTHRHELFPQTRAQTHAKATRQSENNTTTVVRAKQRLMTRALRPFAAFVMPTRLMHTGKTYSWGNKQTKKNPRALPAAHVRLSRSESQCGALLFALRFLCGLRRVRLSAGRHSDRSPKGANARLLLQTIKYGL